MNSLAVNPPWWGLLAVLGAAYPFIVYAGLGRLPEGSFAAIALVLVAARIVAVKGGGRFHGFVPPLLAVGGVIVVMTLIDSVLAAKVYPVAMNFGMSAAFGFSLLRGPSLIETFASLTEPNPEPAARRYMRRLTAVWCLFLSVNGVLSAISVAMGDVEWWTLYNGLISYLLIGGLFAGELIVRKWLKKRVETL